MLETQNQETVGFPRFSRDGRHLAYCLSTPSIGALPAVYEIDTLTFEKHKVTTDGSCSYDWSPDGKTLIYSTPPALEAPSTVANGIWAYIRETGEIKLLIPSEAPVIDPRWSPDGSTISYFDFCFECVGDFHTYDLASGTFRDWPEDTIGPDISWAPDGRSFAYYVYDDLYA